MIIGLLQHNKIKLLDAFDLVPFCKEVYEPLIMEFTEDLSNSTYMQCCLILLNTINKMKKMKLSKDIKAEMEKIQNNYL
ncbi:hypothetical protein NQ317_010329 [Molorchus minor]|uniref:Uncharacterized protein n=1 Tax=Molorchus minor TaxID=1323400 RepID=A0ABQ9J4Z2_9CUCU|nr:hypothetical protein NQ317_010329 [Molorchus minor]